MSEPAPEPETPDRKENNEKDLSSASGSPPREPRQDDRNDRDPQSDPKDQDEPDDDDSLVERVQQEEESLRLRLISLQKLNGGSGPAAGRDWFGGPVTHVSDNAKSYGAGRDLYIVSSENLSVQTPPVPKEYVQRIRDSLVITKSQTALTDLLAVEPLLLLRGSPNTGRTTTAIAALLDVAKSCHRLMVQEDPSQVDVTHLERGTGYFLLADGSPWVTRLEEVADHLSDIATRSRCHIVILGRPNCDLPHRVVDHIQPVASEVFRKAFIHRLGDPNAWNTYKLDDHDIVSRLTDCQPAEAIHLASWLADGVQQDRDVAELLTKQPLFTHKRFREHLDKVPTRSGRCFLVSSAVLHELPEPVVSAAALDLVRQIHEENKEEEESDDTPVWEKLENWLSYSGISMASGDRRGEGRRVQLRNELAPMLLPMIWEELPAVRRHLYTWLHNLGESQDEHIRIKVAHAVGLLMTCDFDHIEKEFLNKWSRDSKVRPKQLAAWALEAAASDPGISDRVDALLSNWSRFGPYDQRTTAAISYGSRAVIRNLDKVLASFRQITRETKGYWLCDAVARSTADIYATDTARPIVAELARWARDDAFGGQLSSALALVRLGPLLHDGARPALADHCDKTDLVTLWSRSLELSLSTDEMTGQKSSLANRLWRLFADWMKEWDRRPSLRPILEGIFSTASTGSLRLRRTYQIYLLIWQQNGSISTQLFRYLIRILKDR
ncbi:hypothetical protein ACFOYY_21115 [Streptosporangium jomthongense]|uniref:Uncharacterized protein n=2 Tax=Streptosporangium jomthongense TaxID=1193683 RepID=A0ABV8F453_9ACTN